MLAERGYGFIVLFNAMSANISEEVLTSKTQGLSDEERLRDHEPREQGTTDKEVVQLNGKEKRKEPGKKRCRSTEVQREREQETQLIYG